MARRKASLARTASWPTVGRNSRLGFVLLFALLLTTSALAYLGVKSVQSEALAARHLLEETHRGIAAIVGERIDALIEQSDRDLLLAVVPPGAGVLDVVAHAHDVATRRVRPETLLLLRADGAVLYPPRGRNTPRPPRRVTSDTRASAFEELRSAAERAELREGRAADAAILYGEALRKADSHEDRALALNGMARCELKAGRPEKALESYRELIASVPPVAPSLARLVLVAHSQSITCYETMTEPAGAARATIDLFDALVGARLVIDEDTYRFYRSRVEDALRERPVEPPLEREVEELRALDRERESVTAIDSMTRLALRFVPSFVEQAGEPRAPRYFATLDPKDGVISMAAIEAAPEEEGVPLLLVHHWAAADLADLTTSVVAAEGSWVETGIVLLGPNGAAVSVSTAPAPDEPPSSAAMLTRLPGWRIAAFPLGGSVEASADRSVRRYGLFLLLVLGTVSAGLVLAARSVSKEVALSRLRSQFVSSVSHELKTPLAVIRLFAENLRAGRVDGQERADYYEVITRESERLTGLIDNVLSMSRIESGTQLYEIRKADLRELVRETVDRYRPHLTAANVELSEKLPQGSVFAPIDREAIAQVLINLLSNATKYIGEGERSVEVALSARGEDAELRVTDTGIGMSPEHIAHAFDRFYRADTPEHAVPGSGIGLTLVRHIVDAHGGDVRVESTPGRGSAFTVMLPLSSSGGLP